MIRVIINYISSRWSLGIVSPLASTKPTCRQTGSATPAKAVQKSGSWQAKKALFF